MDDFILDNDEDYLFEQGQDFQSHKTAYFQLDSDLDCSFDYGLGEKSKSTRDTAQSEQPKQDQFQEKHQETYNQGLYVYTPMKPNRIEIRDQKTKNSYIETKKGLKTETNQLTINYKTLITSLLEELLWTTTLNQEQLRIIDQFKQSKGNLESFRKLFGCTKERDKCKEHICIGKCSDNIRKFCLQKLNSPQVVEKILKSTKMAVENKISGIKYLEALRKGCICTEQLLKWKSD